MLLWMHPIIQLSVTVLSTYVMFMGIQRFRFVHAKAKVRFDWKRHVLLGKIVLAVWFFGFCLGLGMARYDWGTVNLTEGHFMVGMIMAPLIVFGFVSGLILQTPAKGHGRLALVHGVLNTVLFLLSLYQLVTGIGVVRLFLLA
ncbi:MAG: DUF4079 family protein [Desulfovibrionaceae bacterium]